MVWHTAIAGSERAYCKKRYPQPAALHNLSMAECLPTVCRLLAAPPPTCSGDPSTERVTANCTGMVCLPTCKDGYAGTASIVCEVSGESAQWQVTHNCLATCKGLSWHTQRNAGYAMLLSTSPSNHHQLRCTAVDQLQGPTKLYRSHAWAHAIWPHPSHDSSLSYQSHGHMTTPLSKASIWPWLYHISQQPSASCHTKLKHAHACRNKALLWVFAPM